jgi:hypothetical protein
MVGDQGADKDKRLEGNTARYDNASSGRALRGRRTWRAWKSSARERGEITTDQACLARIGKAHAPKPMMYGRDQSDSLIVAMKSANNAEQIGGGVDGAKQRGQRENAHV